MAKNRILSSVGDYRNTILAVLIGAVLFFAVSMLFLRKYESKVELLVIQKQSNWKIDDAYSAAKSAEQISSMLVHAVGTTTFLDRVMSSGFAVEESILDLNLEDRKEEWNRMIKARTVRNSGIIKLNVFHPDKEKSSQIASAAAYVLKSKADQYHGGGDRIEIKTIDGPITSESSMTPYIPINTLLGAVIGLIAGLAIDRKQAGKEDKFNFAGGKGLDFTEFDRGSYISASSDKSNSVSFQPPVNLPG